MTKEECYKDLCNYFTPHRVTIVPCMQYTPEQYIAGIEMAYPFDYARVLQGNMINLLQDVEVVGVLIDDSSEPIGYAAYAMTGIVDMILCFAGFSKDELAEEYERIALIHEIMVYNNRGENVLIRTKECYDDKNTRSKRFISKTVTLQS